MQNAVINSYNGRKQVRFEGRLVSISDQSIENVNGTEYYPCTIKFANVHGEEKVARAIMYKSNYEYGVEVGNTYMCTANESELNGQPSVLITVSHLPMAENASFDDFNFDSTPTYAEVEVTEADAEVF